MIRLEISSHTFESALVTPAPSVASLTALLFLWQRHPVELPVERGAENQTVTQRVLARFTGGRASDTLIGCRLESGGRRICIHPLDLM